LVTVWNATAATIAATTAIARICQAMARVLGLIEGVFAPNTSGGRREVEINAAAARTSRHRPSTAG